MEKNEKMRLVSAPRDRLRFTQPEIENLVLTAIGYPEAFVTDRSRLWDFSFNDIENAHAKSERPGYCVFKIKRPKKHLSPLFPDYRNPDNWEEITYEAKATSFKKRIVRKVMRHTGVDITPVFDEHMPSIFTYVATHMPDEIRKQYFVKPK